MPLTALTSMRVATAVEMRAETGFHRYGPTALWVLLALVAASCYLVFLNGVPDFFADQQNDPFTYLSLAKSLNAGTGYPTKHWFPGFPAILAVALRLTGLDFVRLKFLMVLNAGLLAGACYLYYRSLTASSDARYLALVVMLTPTVFQYSHILMAEIPSVTAVMFALAALERTRRMPSDSRARWWTALLITACAAAILIRGNALALIPALAGALVVPHGRAHQLRSLAAVAIMLVVFGGWSLRNRNVTFAGINNVTYTEEVQAADIGDVWRTGGIIAPQQRASLSDLLHRVSRNVLWYHTYNIADCMMPGSGRLREIDVRHIGVLVASLVSAPVVVGLVPLFQCSPAGALYLLGSLALVLIYPTGGAARMLIPSVPLLVIAGYLGIRMLLGAGISRGWLIAAAFTGLTVCALNGQERLRHPYTFDGFADFLSVLQEARRSGQPGDVLLSDYPDVVSALTDFRGLDKNALIAPTTRLPGRAWTIEGGPAPRLSPADLPTDADRALTASRGDFRLWQVHLRR